ncbi:MAG: ribosome-associated translation inhibitor RaiA, partial [Novosphingobium sp.]|nr:ribosome-associated translation inhibitor RaiA [Novosphingobium sp.]
MDIRVSGHQIDLGEALQAHVNERLNAIVEKYFSRALSANVTFGKAPAGAFRCDIVMHVMHNLTLKGSADAHDAHVACDQAAEKIDKQLRRYK